MRREEIGLYGATLRASRTAWRDWGRQFPQVSGRTSGAVLQENGRRIRRGDTWRLRRTQADLDALLQEAPQKKHPAGCCPLDSETGDAFDHNPGKPWHARTRARSDLRCKQKTGPVPNGTNLASTGSPEKSYDHESDGCEVACTGRFTGTIARLPLIPWLSPTWPSCPVQLLAGCPTALERATSSPTAVCD